MKTRFLAVLSLSLFAPAVLPASPVGTAARLVERLAMQKIPDEGCWFSVTYVSPDRLEVGALPPRLKTARPAGTAIYALVTREDFSALHKLSTDETWHFYAGSPIELLLLKPGGTHEIVIIGPDLLIGQHPQFTVPAGTWMAARPQPDDPSAYTLFGCTLAPGFDYGDYTPGYRDDLQKRYPAGAERIAAFTRDAFLHEPRETVPTAKPAPAAPRPALLHNTRDPAILVAPGTELRELVGRTGALRKTSQSLAYFVLAPGTRSGPGYLKTGEELIVIISGQGTALVDGEIKPVQAGSVLVCQPGVPHSLQAAPDSRLEFYAFVTPAFSPEDYVPVPAR